MPHKLLNFAPIKIFLFLSIPVLFIAFTLAVLEARNITHLFHERPTAITGSPATKGESKGSSASSIKQPTKSTGNMINNDSEDTQGAEVKDNNVGVGEADTLIAPSGIFVSNHHPNLSGAPASNQIQSVCHTSPGATCQIRFEKDGATKSLPPQTTDKGGSAYWTWKLQDIGLMPGSWRVTAKAILNEQIKISSDGMNLEVSE